MDRKLIAVAVSSALALPMAAQAVEFSVSGHVNRAIIVVDQDGNDMDGQVQHVDANSSESRFRFTGSQDTGNGWSAGVQMELGKPGAWRTRHANVYLSGVGGKITLGQGSEATDGVAHADLGGASWLGGVTNWGSYSCAGPACPSNDGNRAPVLRYDTPAIGAAKLSVSTGNDDAWDAKLSVAGSVGDAGYDVRVGYHDGTETTVASAAVGMGQGTSVAVAWSQSDGGGAGYADEYQYLKLDHNYGDGSIGVYYKRGEEGAQNGSLWGVGVGHNIGAGATAYAGWRSSEGDGIADQTLVVVGMRVTFN